MILFKKIKRFFTLVELMVAMGIFSLLMMLMFDIMVQVQDMWKESSSRTQLFENARFALDMLQRDLEGANYISSALVNFKMDKMNRNEGNTGIGFVTASTLRPSASSRARMAECSYYFDKNKGRLLYRLIGDEDQYRFDVFSKDNLNKIGTVRPLEIEDDLTAVKAGEDPTGRYMELVPYVIDCKFWCYKRRIVDEETQRTALTINQFDEGEMPCQVRVELVLMDKENFLIFKDNRSSPVAKKRAANNARRFTRIINIPSMKK